MPELPECLNRRYRTLDNLIQELSTSITSQNSITERPSDTSNVGIRLMCDFWNILKDDPDCNLTQEVRQRMCTGSTPSLPRKPYEAQRYFTYMTDKACCEDKKTSRSTPKKNSYRSNIDCNSKADDSLPLSKVLCNLKEAASFDQKCHARVRDLMAAQRELTNQIQILEKRESEGVQLLKQADCMWLCMEDAYKKKVSESLDRQKDLLKELKDVEGSVSKWRKNKKDLEHQIDNMVKVRREINEKINHRKNDDKIMRAEIENFKKRIESNNKDLENTKKSFSSKKEASDARLASIAAEISKIQKKTKDEICHKRNKEEEGTKYVKEAREDLQKICKVLLQKKIENEDLKAEKTAILEELDLLNKAANSCKERCQNKEEGLNKEIDKLGTEIAEYKNKCIQCHACVDTNDVRKMCTDCPRCLEEYDCIEADGVCNANPTLDCICMSVKQKFLDNVFDNMYTVLERQSKTSSGKAVADAVLECLKRNRNGKLTSDARRILQDFILTTVKKNLNLTIVGGAVKTRCEMDPETYKQLMLCLNQVEAVQPPKEDKGTASRKDPCARWGGSIECHCPKGPKSCVCTKKAPPPPNDPTPCPQDKEDIGPAMICPYNSQKVCGPDCGMQGKKSPEPPSIDVAKWRPDPCSGATCTFTKNMRAAQCILGPEDLSSRHMLEKSTGKMTASYTYTGDSTAPHCHPDTKHLKADVEQFCDKSTGAQLRDVPIKYLQRKFSQVQKSRNVAMGNNEDAPVSKIHISRNVCFKRQNQEEIFTYMQTKSGPSTAGRIPRPGTESKHFKIAIENNEGQLGNQLTALTKTESGKLAMELDEELIQLIEKKINENPNAFISLTRSESGHIVIVFDIRANEVLNDQRATVRRTPSGTRLLGMHKGLVKKIQGQKQKNPQLGLKDTQNINEQKDIQVECKLLSQSDNRQCSWEQDECGFTNKNVAELSRCCPLPPVREQLGKNYGRDQSSKDALSEYFNVSNVYENSSMQAQDSLSSISWTSEASKKAGIENPLLDYSHEIQQLYEKGDVVVTFQIETRKALFRQFETVISKSFSGTISADLLNKSPLERIPLDKLYPVCLTKTTSGKFLVTIDSSSQIFNAVIRKMSSGNIVLIPKNPQTKTNMKKKLNTDSAVQKFFKLKVSGYNNHLITLPAVLKLTLSENYLIILDKEFEKRYKQTVYDYVGKERECFVYLKKIGSSYILNLNTDASIPPGELNALLVKSRSGNIKILVHGPVFESIDASTAKRSSISSAQVFGELLGELQPASCRKIHKKDISKRAYSDSQLKERVNVKLQINKNMFTEPLAILKKSDSGKYAIVLNEESKKCFINYSRSYLSRNPKGLVPVKRTHSGQILIVLDSEVEGEGYYGSLKITSSGNIHVNVDGEALRRLNVDPNKENKSSKVAVDAETLKILHGDPNKVNKTSKITDTRPYNYGTINKAVTTTCNARSDICDCDTSQCVCAELEHEIIEWVDHGNAIGQYSEGRLRQPMSWMTPKSCTDQQCSEACSERTSNVITPRPKSPHIVIKPATEYPPSNQTFGSTENSFYVVNTVCQYHKNRYETVSNELLEISGLCNKGQEALNDSLEFTSNNVDSDVPHGKVAETWDSLSYLPPQLPSFLCNISYR